MYYEGTIVLYPMASVYKDVIMMECACGSVSVQPSMPIEPIVADWLWRTMIGCQPHCATSQLYL